MSNETDRYQVTIDDKEHWLPKTEVARHLGGTGLIAVCLGDKVLELPGGAVRDITEDEKREIESASDDWAELK